MSVLEPDERERLVTLYAERNNQGGQRSLLDYWLDNEIYELFLQPLLALKVDLHFLSRGFLSSLL